jgi:hypothetical protein
MTFMRPDKTEILAMIQSTNRQLTIGKVIAWIAGIVGAIIAGVAVFLITTGNLGLGGLAGGVGVPSATADSPVSRVWKEGNLTLPVSSSDGGQAADLDTASLLPLGTSIPASNADIIVRQSPHSVVLEPGLSQGDGVTFGARFTDVNDAAVGREGCVAAAISPRASNHLQLSFDIDVGSHICMVTNQGRPAEFKINRVSLSGSTQEVELAFVVWMRE